MKSISPLPALIGALTISLPIAHATDIPTVLVGSPGNDAQSAANRSHAFSGGDGRGSVAYSYHIGTTSVTNSQYVAFLNAVAASDPHGLYFEFMTLSASGGIERFGAEGSYTYQAKAGMENKPVIYVNFWDAARFANWLTNGRPTGAQDDDTTETGMYALGGVTNPTNNTVFRDAAAWEAGGVAIASEDEWFKAAYFNPATGDYSLYATGSDLAPTAESPPGGANSANVDGGPGVLTDAGAYLNATSHFGTHDQLGNTWDWVETIRYTTNRKMLGGSFLEPASEGRSQASGFNHGHATAQFRDIGFRVTSLNPIQTQPPAPVCEACAIGFEDHDTRDFRFAPASTVNLPAIVRGPDAVGELDFQVSVVGGTAVPGVHFVNDFPRILSFGENDFNPIVPSFETLSVAPEEERTVILEIESLAAGTLVGQASTIIVSIRGAAVADVPVSPVAVTITSPDVVEGGLTNLEFITLDIVFAEPVTGFHLRDLNNTNYTGVSLTGEGAVYQAVVSPVADGFVKVAIPAVRANAAAPPFHATAHVEITFDSDQTAPQSEILTDHITRVGDELTGRFGVADPVGGVENRMLWIKKPGATEWEPDPLLTIGMNLDERYPPLGEWEPDPLMPPPAQAGDPLHLLPLDQWEPDPLFDPDTWEPDPLMPTVYAWNYTPDAGPGIYRFAIVATDAAGNAVVEPTSDEDGVAVVWNSAPNAPFSYDSISGGGTFLFPMTNELTVALEFDPGVLGGPITVTRTVGSPPIESGIWSYMPPKPDIVLGEYLDITGSFTGGDATLVWDYDPAHAPEFAGNFNTFYRINESGDYLAHFDATPTGNRLTASGIDGFSRWIAGVGAVRTYQRWVDTYELDPAHSDPAASHDGDGVPNLIKYALGITPGQLITDRSLLPALSSEDVIDFSSGGLEPAPHSVFRFKRHLDRTDVMVAAEYSLDLAEWFPLMDEFDPDEPVGGELEPRRALKAISEDEDKVFFRLSVESM